jgi:hypothetical protein
MSILIHIITRSNKLKNTLKCIDHNFNKINNNNRRTSINNSDYNILQKYI